ncbi:MAG: FkbM family methyltransferase [Thioploca sp.]|nr:FkbM family methyltransferase [Thioploca sp.]
MSKLPGTIKNIVRFIIPFPKLRQMIKRIIVVPYYFKPFGFKYGLFLLKTIWLKDFIAILLNKHDLIEISIPHIKAPILLRLNSILIFEQVFIYEEYRIPIPSHIKPQLIIDGGAHFGFASIYFANQFPEAKIFAIEPSQVNLKVLKENVSCYPQVTVIPAAIWNEKIPLENPRYNVRGGAGFRVSEAKSTTTELIHSITIEDILQLSNSDRISILKLDVEGAEKEIFSNSDNWINKIDMIIVELHDRFKPGCKEAFESATSAFEFQGKYGENIVKIKKIA